MHEGFDITFHEVIPESDVVELVLHELEKVSPPPGLHCSVIVSHAGPDALPFDVQVELRAGPLETGLRGYAVDNDQYTALRQAFAALRDAVEARDPAREQKPKRRAGAH